MNTYLWYAGWALLVKFYNNSEDEVEFSLKEENPEAQRYQTI